MRTISAATLAATALLLLCLPARAIPVVDTGTPNSAVLGAYAFDSVDYVAGEVSFLQSLRINAVSFHVLGATAGETFTIALYTDSASHLPGNILYSGIATLGMDGWNGLSGLSGWSLAAGRYWLAAEIGPNDTAGNGSLTGTLLDRRVPHPLALTAFNSGAGYQTAALDFGLRVDATVTPVPEPESWALMLIGLGAIPQMMRRRRRQFSARHR